MFFGAALRSSFSHLLRSFLSYLAVQEKARYGYERRQRVVLLSSMALGDGLVALHRLGLTAHLQRLQLLSLACSCS